MNRQSLADLERAIREELHEIRDAVNLLSMRVDLLWEDRKRREVKPPLEEDRR